MPDRTYLDWPFFAGEHRALVQNLSEWAAAEIATVVHEDVDALCREYVRRLGAAGWLRYVVPKAYGGVHDTLDLRSICLIRETLAFFSPLADFAFAMQGLGTAPITLFGSEELKGRFLPDVAAGKTIAAFAVSEPEAGSDLAAMKTTARRVASGWRIDGAKTWISNAGIADHYVVFARLPEEGDSSFGAFLVEASRPGFRVAERINLMAEHPIGTISFEGCTVPEANRVGASDSGLKVALATLDLFRSSVGAAALGMARRALDEAVSWTKERQAFGQALADFQMTQARIAEMATGIDAAALLVYRAAWTKDGGAARITREAAMAKLTATETAQTVVDGALQLLGGRGVVAGNAVERLYREVRALRIYEGTSEIQKLIIAGQVLGSKG